MCVAGRFRAAAGFGVERFPGMGCGSQGVRPPPSQGTEGGPCLGVAFKDKMMQEAHKALSSVAVALTDLSSQPSAPGLFQVTVLS